MIPFYVMVEGAEKEPQGVGQLGQGTRAVGEANQMDRGAVWVRSRVLLRLPALAVLAQRRHRGDLHSLRHCPRGSVTRQKKKKKKNDNMKLLKSSKN